MNLTTGTTLSSPFKRLKAQYLALACGIALAITGVAVVSGNQADPHKLASPQTAISTAPRTFGVEHYILYLVASEQQRDSLIESAQGDDFPGPNSYIVIIHSPQDELTMGYTQAELTDVGHIAQVIDLRDR